jgi:hypothetical protein
MGVGSLGPRQVFGLLLSGLGWVILGGFGLLGLVQQLATGRVDALAEIVDSKTAAWLLVLATTSVFLLLGLALIKLGRRLRSHQKTEPVPNTAPSEAPEEKSLLGKNLRSPAT